jgi:UDP-N-acetyl-2-amino-2-deoxyglucuronate dehydrogenase
MNEGLIGKVNIGILGCGRVSEHYADMLININPLSNINICACCDVKKNKVERLANKFSSNKYTSLKDMLKNESLDAVFVLTPSGNHFENVKYILSNNINVLVEKPLCMTLDQASELMQLSKLKGLICATVFQNRYNPSIVALKKAFSLGRFGKIISASIRLRWCRFQSYYEDEWHGTWLMDGGVINQQAIHHIDVLNWVVGPVKSVIAQMDNRVNHLEAEDTLTGLVNFENGGLGTIEVTTAARPRDFEASLSIVGESGSATIGGIALNKIIEWEFTPHEQDDLAIIELNSEEVPSGYGLSHTRQINQFAECILTKKTEAPVKLEESIETLRFVHAIYRSVEEKKWVHLKDGLSSNKLGIGE